MTPRIDRRSFLEMAAATGILPGALVEGAANQRTASRLGEWMDDIAGMPAFRYTGPLRFDASGLPVDEPFLPNDPHFLLGNHRLTLFAHASGRLRLISGERGWARLNGVAGENQAGVTLNEVVHPLTGLDNPIAAAAGKLFSLSAARYTYALPHGMTVVRSIAVQPSIEVGKGLSGLILTVQIRNEGTSIVRTNYDETFTGDYRPIWPPWSRNITRVRHERGVSIDPNLGVAWVHTRAVAIEPLVLPPRPAMSEFDANPPSLFIATGTGTVIQRREFEIGVHRELVLAPQQQIVLCFVVGYSFDPAVETIRGLADALLHAAPPGLDPFAQAWSARVSAFPDEPDPSLRREMRWNAGVLEAMATWREYYDETVVPQGTTYDYKWGILASSRDLAQHALPLCQLNPPLARSVLRYLFKRTLPDGEIKLNDEGFGWSSTGSMQTSDQQLYLFMLLAEYLRATGDPAVLDETVSYYPAENAGRATGLEHVARAFLFLRDRIGVGEHGLLKLWNSDWNDMFYHFKTPLPYSELFGTAESHLNAAIALNVLADLARQLRRLDDTREAHDLAHAMDVFRSALLKSFLADLGDRGFSRRAYLGKAGPVGETVLWLEPQGFTLFLAEFSPERKRRLWREIDRRLCLSAGMVPKQIEVPETRGDLQAGSRENGGFWYSLAGPVVLGLSTFDRTAARALLRRMTFAYHMERWPAYWTGQWSAADSLDAAPLPTEGLSSFDIYCAHAHAWPLFCYLVLREDERLRMSAA